MLYFFNCYVNAYKNNDPQRREDLLQRARLLHLSKTIGGSIVTILIFLFLFISRLVSQ